jgi:hypothetical protein
VFGVGADCIAVVSDVTQHADPDKRVRDWLALTRHEASFDRHDDEAGRQGCASERP